MGAVVDMGEKKETESFVCWLNETEKIMSFHYEEGYIRKEFKSKPEFQEFIMFAVSCGYRVQ